MPSRPRTYLPAVMTGNTRAAWRDETKKCPTCGETFWPKPHTSAPKWREQVYCSQSCVSTATHSRNLRWRR